SADSANTKGPMCSLRTYLVIIFTREFETSRSPGTLSLPQGCTTVYGLYIPPATCPNSRLPRRSGFVRFFSRQRVVPLFKPALGALFVLTVLGFPSALSAQTPPPRDTARADSARRVVMPRPPADSADSTKRPNVLTGLPGLDSLPFK